MDFDVNGKKEGERDFSPFVRQNLMVYLHYISHDWQTHIWNFNKKKRRNTLDE